MAKDQGLDDQIEDDEELLNFDLDDLSLSEDFGDDPDADEEVIELVDLVERGSSEDITRDLKAREWAAAGQKKEGSKTREITRKEIAGAEDEEDLDLNLSDLSIELEIGTEREKAAPAVTEDEITEADLERLLQEDDSLTLEFSQEKPLKPKEKKEDEITEADLQALLSESGEQALEEGASDLEPLDLSLEEDREFQLEPADETQSMDLEPAVEESFPGEEPTAMLAEEAEQLGAAAEHGEAESDILTQGLQEPEEPEEPEKPAETEVWPEFEEEASPGETEAFGKETPAGISEERLEEIITNVVRDVVERVARETMAEVAERMIGEAIETLKQSLEVSES